MKEMDPHDFEGLVLDVLAAMGYGGGSRQAMQGVPRGPDGGIDGKINEDKLGLDQIYMQAKRYSENSVSSEKGAGLRWSHDLRRLPQRESSSPLASSRLMPSASPTASVILALFSSMETSSPT